MTGHTQAALALATEVGAAMFAKDRIGHRLGMRVEAIRPGYARLVMQVSADMINGHDICHGAFTFALADTACAYACNSHNHNALSQALNIVFLSPARLGETLVGEAVESARAGRTLTYEITIKSGDERMVAVAQAQCRMVSGQMVGPAAAPA